MQINFIQGCKAGVEVGVRVRVEVIKNQMTNFYLPMQFNYCLLFSLINNVFQLELSIILNKSTNKFKFDN